MTRRGLVVDFAGVLTFPLEPVMLAWIEADGLDLERAREHMQDLYGRSANEVGGIVHGLETGGCTPWEFEVAFAKELADAGVGSVEAVGLLERMFGGLVLDHGMHDLVEEVRGAGIKTVLCSNSFGIEYPRERWGSMFDDAVISAEVGLRKPDVEIYHLACGKIGLAPQDCVLVDDMEANIEAAAELGMATVLHTDTATTRTALRELLDF